MTFRCRNCIHARSACSFRERRWGISVLPKLKKTRAGDAVRRKNAKERTGYNKRKRGAGGSKSKKARCADSSSSDSETPSADDRRPTPNAAKQPVLGGKVDGQQEVLLFEDCGRFDEILGDTDRTAVSVADGLVDIHALLRREENMARDVAARVEERALFLRTIEEDLKAEAARLRAAGRARSGPAPSGSGASGEAGPSRTSRD